MVIGAVAVVVGVVVADDEKAAVESQRWCDGAREQAGKHFHQKSKVRGSTGCGGSSERDIHQFGTKRQSRNWSWYSTFTYLVKVVSTLRLHQRVKLKMKLK